MEKNKLSEHLGEPFSLLIRNGELPFEAMYWKMKHIEVLRNEYRTSEKYKTSQYVGFHLYKLITRKQ